MIPKVPDKARYDAPWSDDPLDAAGLFLELASKIENRMFFEFQNWDAIDHLQPKAILSRIVRAYGYIPPFAKNAPSLQKFEDDYMLELFRIHYRKSAHPMFRRSVLGLFGPKKRVITGIPPAVQSQMKRILSVDFHGLWRNLQTEWGLEVEKG